MLNLIILLLIVSVILLIFFTRNISIDEELPNNVDENLSNNVDKEMFNKTDLVHVFPPPIIYNEKNNILNRYKDWMPVNSIFSSEELNFYRLLINYTIDKNILIFPKIRIADLVKTKHSINYSEFSKTFLKLSQKHVDFVITNSKWKILCLIELDWSSHNYSKTIKNDEFKNDFFNVLWIPLLRFKNYSSHNLSRIDNYLV